MVLHSMMYTGEMFVLFVSFCYFLAFIFFFIVIVLFYFFFFFSSRRRHTRSYGDWSSDVCSSDLLKLRQPFETSLKTKQQRMDATIKAMARLLEYEIADVTAAATYYMGETYFDRSEERRVGKECRSRWAMEEEKKKSRKRRVEGVG